MARYGTSTGIGGLNLAALADRGAADAAVEYTDADRAYAQDVSGITAEYLNRMRGEGGRKRGELFRRDLRGAIADRNRLAMEKFASPLGADAARKYAADAADTRSDAYMRARLGR